MWLVFLRALVLFPFLFRVVLLQLYTDMRFYVNGYTRLHKMRTFCGYIEELVEKRDEGMKRPKGGGNDVGIERGRF